MKRPFLIFVSLILSLILLSQVPQAFKYQAIARDIEGSVLVNQSISFQISILEGNETGVSVYTEIHTAITNDYGLVSLEIGNGTNGIGDFANIDWGSNTFFLKIEMDESGGSNFHQMGVSQMLSVPYALHSKTSDDDSDWTVSGNNMYSSVTGNVGVGTVNPQIPIDVFGYSGEMINGMIARFDSDETDYSRIVIDGASGADAQLSFMNNSNSKWSMGNDASRNNSFVLRSGYGSFGTGDVFVLTPNAQADLNLPMLGNLGGLTIGKKAAEQGGVTFSIVRSIGAHSVDTRYVSGIWAQSFGAYNNTVKLGNIGLYGSNKNVVDFMSFGAGGVDWWDTYSKFSVNKFGNVGIGRFAVHKSPTAKLEIDGSENYDLLKINTAADNLAMIVDSSGDVGIGTLSPMLKLEVNGGIKLGDPDENDDGLLDADGVTTVPGGTMRWKKAETKLQVFDGASWVNLH